MQQPTEWIESRKLPMHSIYTRNSTDNQRHRQNWYEFLELTAISGVVTHSGLLQQLTQGMKQKYNNAC